MMTHKIYAKPVRSYRRFFIPVLAATMLLGLAGCNHDERPLSYNKGVYGGKADQKLDADTVRELQYRSNYQRSSN